MQPREIAKDVFVAEGRDVNWAILREGDSLTLVDTGYPRYVDQVIASIRAIGNRPEDVVGIVITHAHVDHVGGVRAFKDRFNTPVFTDPLEVGHARRDYLEQVTPVEILKNAWRPRVLPWTMRIMQAGGTDDVAAPWAEAWQPGTDGRIDLPGRPMPVPTHAHTKGHAALLLPDSGVLFTGDELMSGHGLTAAIGPQPLPAMFSHASSTQVDQAWSAMAAVDADIIAPGHGRVLQMPIAEAIAVARSRSV